MRLGLGAIAAMTLAAAPGFAQWDSKTPGIPRSANGKPDLSAAAPRTSDGKPDLTGIWQAGRAGPGGGYGYDYNVAQNLPANGLTAWAKGVRQQRVQDFRKDSPLAHCMPMSIPFLSFRGLSRIVQTPGMIVILYESPNSPHRTIFLDGRPLPKDPDPTWLGYSVGHWEGDTLVVNSAGFNDRGWLDVGGNPQTESLKLTERYRRPDFGHLQLDMTFEDPKVFTQPFNLHMDKTYTADTEILEDVCENERDSRHLVSGYRVPPEVLAKYAGTYQLPGREAVVTVSGDQLLVNDSANSRDQLFVARTETEFQSSVSEVSIEFFKDSSGAVTHFMRTGGAKDEKAMRKATTAQR
ncbi:MAG TPA: hypothetical protein VLY24_28250 [Bryobacteraceae bacterium]|nr:hypothetical protein [Bryobacteraceae bacterium]